MSTDIINMSPKHQLPDTIPDLTKFVLIGREKLNSVRAEIRAIEKVCLAREVRNQKLQEAQEIAEAVLDAEVKLGELIGAIPENQGKRSDLQLLDSAVKKSKKDIIEEAGLSIRQANRFETLSNHPDIVERIKAEARDNDEIVNRTKVLEEISKEKKPFITNNSGNYEWYTPNWIIEAARKVMGDIDLDPASCEFANRTVKATHYYTESTNGLIQRWFGRIWLNPPYSLVSQFAYKLIESDFEQALMLVNNATETRWFADLTKSASAVVFLTGRTHFDRADGSSGAPMQGQSILYCGPNTELFLEIFKEYGWCARL